MAAEVRIDVIAQDSFSSVLGNFGSIITGIESAIRLAGDAFNFFKDQALQGLDAIASYERLAASFETLVAKELLMTGAAGDMTEALAISGTQAEELLRWNQELAINSPFTSEGVAEALRMAMAYGFTVTEAQRLTEALIDFAAGSGASEYAMQAIARALGQISATGRVTGGDMLQLVNAGLPVVEILAEGFGVTTAELMEMREKGLLPATEAIEYITAYLETNFAGAAQRQANTWAGLQGTFEDIQQMGLREFFGGLFDVLQPLAVQLSGFLQTEGLERLSEWGERLGAATLNVIEFARSIPAIIEGIREFVDINFGGGIDMFARFWEMFVRDVIPELRDHLPIIRDLFRELSANILPDLVFLFNYIAAWFVDNEDLIIRTIERAVRMFEALIVVVGRVWDVVYPLIVGITALGGILTNAAMTIFTAFDNIGSHFVEIGGDIMTNLLQGLMSAFYMVTGFFGMLLVGAIKNALGVSSPSTVFFEIGQDLLRGLIAGMGSMLGGVLDVFNSILGIFGIGGTSGQTGPIGGGTVGSGAGDTGHTRGGIVPAPTTGTGGNTLIFYGPVYVGSIDQLMYDCAQTNPLLQAGSSFATSGI